MTYLTATDKPLYWTALLGANIIISDIAEISGKIGIPPTMTATSNTDANVYLGAMAGKGGTYNPLPATGTIEAGKIYSYGGNLVICRQTHERTIYAPVDTPALFSVYRAGQDGVVLDWVANEPVMIGMHRIYNGVEYICIQLHTTQIDWAPPAVPALWQVYVIPSLNWAVGVAYKVGDIVTYQGSTYRCLQVHTSIVTWTPTAAVSLWVKV